MADPQRIAFLGDVHMSTQWTRLAIRYADAGGADVIVQLGDYGYTYSREFVDGVEDELDRVGLELWFVDGNHDNPDYLNTLPVLEDGTRRVSEHVRYLPRGHRWTWGGVQFVALGGAHSVDRPYRVPGVSWWPGERIRWQDRVKVVWGGHADVLVSHDCPAGVMIPGIDDRTTPPPFDAAEIVRSQEHRVLLASVLDAVRPSSVWHGHYHGRYETVTDLGYGPVRVNGLSCDGTSFAESVVLVDVADLLPRPAVKNRQDGDR